MVLNAALQRRLQPPPTFSTALSPAPVRRVLQRDQWRVSRALELRVRIRNIKPEFWGSESNGRLSRDARLVFVGLFSVADDEGRFRAALPYLAGLILPYDSDGQQIIAKTLPELAALDKIVLFRRHGFTYGALLNFAEHQRPSHPQSSKLPEPPKKASKSFRNESVVTPEPLRSDTQSPLVGSGRGSGSGSGSGNGRPDETLPVRIDASDSTVITPATAKHLLPIFFLWIKETRTAQQLKLETEPKSPDRLKWWQDIAKRESVTLGGLKAAYASFLGDVYWRTAVPAPWPIRGFAAQWGEQPNVNLNAGAPRLQLAPFPLELDALAKKLGAP